MALEYILFYHSYRKKMEKLSDQEVGRLVRALLKYSETGETQELTGRESIAFDFIADDIDRAKATYKEKCAKNKKNVRKRYDGEQQGATTEYDRIRPYTTEYERYQDKDKDKDKDKDNTLSSNDDKSKGARNTRFTPPSVEEVAAYVAENGYIVDAEDFVDFYTAKGWMVGKNHMTDWQAAVRTWERKRREEAGEQPTKQEYRVGKWL